MKKSSLFCIAICLSMSISAQFSASGFVAEQIPANGTGLETIYLFNTLTGSTISYRTTNTLASFYTYSASEDDKELIASSDITSSTEGGYTTYTLANLTDSKGYLVNDNNQWKAVWVIDYNLHKPLLHSITAIESEDRCSYLKLAIDKTDALTYMGTNGIIRAVKREYTIEYDNLAWDEASKKFTPRRLVIPAQEIGTELLIVAPINDTQFILKGDQFATTFGQVKEIISPVYAAVSVEAHIESKQEMRDADNELASLGSDLGGSGPLAIAFLGHGNEPVARYYTWLIYNKKDMKTPLVRYTDKDINYTFDRSGSYTVLLEVADRTSSCVDSVSIDFDVSDFFLDIPNYFSPGDSPGSNDEFKVAYRSIVKFKCTIFNRWGVKLYQWTDPSKGWDGRYKGSYVNPGVYFYVIEAEGADGKSHKKGGDINILRSK